VSFVPGKTAAPRGQATQAGRQADEGGAAAAAEPDPASHCRVLPVGAVKGAPLLPGHGNEPLAAGCPGLLLFLSGYTPCEEVSSPQSSAAGWACSCACAAPAVAHAARTPLSACPGRPCPCANS